MAETSPASMLQGARELWARLSSGQRMTIIAAGVVTVALVAVLVNLGGQPYELLYEGLNTTDSTAIVQQLRTRGIDYKLADGGAKIEVRGAGIADLQLDFISQGLPQGGTSPGYEIFDKTQLGATGFTDDINLKRALQGELARTIRGFKEVLNARVHLVLPGKRAFGLQKGESKASVALELRPGSQMTPARVRGLQLLVASAIEGLAPDSVTILDGNSEPLSRSVGGANTRSEAELSEREQVEGRLRDKVDSILEPLFGVDHFSTRVSADLDFAAVEETAELVDPEARAMISEHLQQEGLNAGAGGTPGVAGNVDTGAAATVTRGRDGAALRSTTTRNWEISKTVRRTISPRYRLERLSVAVVIDQAKAAGGAPDAAGVESLLAAAVGLDTARGDRLEVSVLPFGVVEEAVVPEVGAVEQVGTLVADWGRPVGVVLLVICAWLFFLRPLQRQATLALREAAKRPQALPPASVAAVVAAQAAGAPLSAAEMVAAEVEAHASGGEAALVPADPTTRLRETLVERAVVDPAATARTLRGWLGEDRP